jgi:ribonuclease T2
VPRLRKAPPDVTSVYPTENLFRHEWRQHGSCSGLSPAAYLDLTRKLRQRFQVPALLQAPDKARSLPASDLRQAVLSDNPGLPPDGVVLSCKGNRLSELRLCFTKSPNGKFRACPASMIADAASDCPGRIRIRALP